MALSKKSKYSFKLILLVIVGTLFFMWTRFQAESSARKVRNIVLISIDTCRMDHLSCYGFPKPTTPNIDAVAGESILFENAVSPIPLTLPAHTSMLTGTNPVYHDVHHNLGYQVSPENLTLPEILREQGYTTAAFIGSFVLDSKFGLDQGFDTYNDEFEDVHQAVTINERKASETSRLAGDWLEKNRADKFFLFLHFYDPHDDYDPPEPAASKFPDDLYSGEIAYTDDCIGQVIKTLKRLGLYESSLIIITSDHGEMLGEHNESTHGFFIYQSALRVPLIFKLPGNRKRKSVPGLTSIIDIVPTILQMLELEIPSHIQGKDLSGYFGKNAIDDKDRHVYCETQEPAAYGANGLLGVISPRYKYIQTTRPELYDLINDPCELNDLSLTEPKRARMMQATLSRIMEESVNQTPTDTRMPLDDEAVRRLGALGYVGSTEAEDFVFDQSRPDPKDVIAFVTQSSKGFNFLHSEKYNEAIAEYDKAIALKPEFPKTYYNRGYCYMALKNYDQAIVDFSLAIERDPNYSDAYDNRGTCYRHKGDDLRSISDYIRVVELNPDKSDVRKYIGLALIRIGKSQEAIVHLREGLKLKQDWPVVLNTLAWVLATHKDKNIYDATEALELAQRACELTNNANHITLHTLAVAYAENDRFNKAVEVCRKAVDIAITAGRKDLTNKFRSHLQLFKAERTVPRIE
jgi:arylsulfatase A-like enzyme/Flp pilus assembly protein TadD